MYRKQHSHFSLSHFGSEDTKSPNRLNKNKKNILKWFTGRYPYKTSGYLSEPEPNYDSDYSIYKHSTLDRRRNPPFNDSHNNNNNTSNGNTTATTTVTDEKWAYHLILFILFIFFVHFYFNSVFPLRPPISPQSSRYVSETQLGSSKLPIRSLSITNVWASFEFPKPSKRSFKFLHFFKFNWHLCEWKACTVSRPTTFIYINKNKKLFFFAKFIFRHYGTMPTSIKCGSGVYRNQPGRIENYVPGHSSVSDKERKEVSIERKKPKKYL